MMRSFIAIPIPDANLNQIADWIRALRELSLHARFSRVESIHLTLRFLGNIEESEVPGMGRALDSATSGIPAFNVEIAELGTFPSSRNPRVVWIGISEDPTLRQLYDSVEKALSDCGWAPESRPFRPHLTLARMKSKRNLKALRQFLKQEGKRAEAGTFTVQSFHLYQSILHPSGAEYRRLTTHQLEAK